MDIDIQKAVSQIKRGACGEQELDLVQLSALKDLVNCLEYHMRQHQHYRAMWDNEVGRRMGETR